MRLGGWKTASFLVGSESNVRHWGRGKKSLQAARARSKKTRNKKQEARSKKQEARKQQEEQENEEDEEEDPSFTSSRFRK